MALQENLLRNLMGVHRSLKLIKSVLLRPVAINEVEYDRSGSQEMILTLVWVVHIVLKNLKQRSYHGSNHEPSLLAASGLEQSMRNLG